MGKSVHACPESKKGGYYSDIPQGCIKGSEYANQLKNAKVVVCPWGYGERTACDAAGWLAGAVVVKPCTDWQLAFPDMYRAGATYVAVRPDWSDLVATVRHIVTHYDEYWDMRFNARQTFLA